MAAINDYYYEDLTPETLRGAAGRVRRGQEASPGSAIGRQGSAPEGGPLTLTDAKLYDGSLGKKIKIPNLPPKPTKTKAPA